MAQRSQTQPPALWRSSLTMVTAVFVLIFVALQVAMLLLKPTGQLHWLMTTTASAAGTLIGWAGMPVTISGTQLVMTNHTLQIDVDCTGINVALLYVALVVAYPLSARTRLLAVALGVPVIALANLGRLLGTALASEHLSASMFRFTHDYLFKVAMVLVVIGLWAVWLQVARIHATRA